MSRAYIQARVTLTAANMGDDVEEADFDAWAAFVAKHIDAKTRMDIQVERAAFRGGPARDRIQIQSYTDDDEACRDRISDALADLWAEWCEGGAS